MTEKEAIQWLRAIKDKYIHGGDENMDEKRTEALDLAIAALERERWHNAESDCMAVASTTSSDGLTSWTGRCMRANV